MNAITTHDLCKKYGNKNVVNNLNLEVPKGAIYGFIGRNGAGKSTTQKLVCGLINASEGEVSLFEKPLTDVDVRSKVGTLIEQPGLYPGMSALDNVIMQGYSIGVDDPKKKALEALDTVGLSKAAKKKAKHLSLGMKQRLGLAIAMLGDPELLVLDEPINGLDPEGIVQLRQVIEVLHRDKGITFFMSSHILGELSKIATHYGIIKDGVLVEQVSAVELASKRKDYLYVGVNNAHQAIALLKEQLDLKTFEVVSDSEIRLFNYNDTKTINKVLSANDFDVAEIFLHQQDLEEYFLELMGGNSNA
jgi:ABC-type multidrug transport system, ATPase component